MKLRKSFLLLVLTSGALLASCNPETPIEDPVDPPIDDPIDDPTDEPSEPEDPIVFGESDYDADLLGTFYSRSGVLDIEANSLTLKGEEELTLKPTSIEEITDNNAIRSAVFYEDESTNETYRIHLNYEEKMELSLEKLDGEDYVLVDDFMPAIDEFVGVYSAYGDHNLWNILLIIGGEYSDVYDNFSVNYAGANNAYNKTMYYAKSYYQVISGERKLMIDILDYEDEYLYYSLYATVENNVTNLWDVSLPDYATYMSDFGLIFNTYFVDSETTLAFGYETDDWSALKGDKVTIGEEEFTISFGYDTSTYYILKNETRELTIKPYYHGIKVTENGETKSYPINEFSHLNGAYKDSEIEFSFDSYSEEVKVNGQVVPFEKKVVDGKLGVSVTVNGNEHFFSEFKDNIAITVQVGDTSRYLVAYDTFLGNFKHDYEAVVDGVSDTLTIGDDFEVTYLGKKVDANLVYDPLAKFPSVVFELDGKTYVFSIVELSNEIYSLTVDGNTKYFFTDAIFEGLRKEYTSGKGDIAISGTNINYLGETTKIDVKPLYDSYSFVNNIAVYFTTESGEEHSLIYYKYGMMADYLVDDPNPIETYISQKDFDDLVGRYVFTGTYGDEAFELTSDGKFYADVLNETGDGLVLRQEKDYHVGVSLLANGTSQVTLQFYHDGLWVYLYKNAYSVTCFETRYTDERLHAVNGTYASANNESVVFINRDKLYVDGTEATINSLNGELKASGVIALNVTVNGETKDLEFTLDSSMNVSSVSFGEETLTDTKLDLDVFKGTYTDASDNIIAVNDFIGLGGAVDGLTIKVTPTSGFAIDYTDYTVVSRNGNLALKVAGLGVDYYLIYDGEKVTAESESSLPPIPPLPPM